MAQETLTERVEKLETTQTQIASILLKMHDHLEEHTQILTRILQAIERRQNGGAA